MTRLTTKLRRLGLAVLLAPALLLGGCTDLGEEVFTSVRAEDFFQNEEQVTAAIVPAYAQLRAMLWAYHNLSQVSSDETIVPTRGSDWSDGGRWLDMHRHNWTPSLVDLNDAWVAAFGGVARINSLLQALQTVDNEFVAQNGLTIDSELRTLRAFYYYQMLDLFGNVPIVGDEDGEFLADQDNPPVQATRAEVFAFVTSELEAILARDGSDGLPVEGAQLGRVTQGVAKAMLANLYLNAGVFTKSSDALNTNGYNSCTEVAGACETALRYANELIDSGNYALSDSYAAIFAPDNEGNPEHIFFVQHNTTPGLGMSFPMRYLHYNQVDPSPWNGFSTIAETYDSFLDEDQRKDIFLIGQQINFETGEEVNDRNGNPLVFTRECGDVNNTTEGACVRVAKFPPDVNFVDGNGHSNDYAFFRLGEMHLIKAEVLNEQGNRDAAIAELNALRARSFDADGGTSMEDFMLDAGDFGSTDALREQILQERLYELIYEAKRRQDLVRFGGFEDAWEFKDASDSFRTLFPIPQLQRDSNPNLSQNPGY